MASANICTFSIFNIKAQDISSLASANHSSRCNSQTQNKPVIGNSCGSLVHVHKPFNAEHLQCSDTNEQKHNVCRTLISLTAGWKLKLHKLGDRNISLLNQWHLKTPDATSN
jgi:hypothetical protein